MCSLQICSKKPADRVQKAYIPISIKKREACIDEIADLKKQKVFKGHPGCRRCTIFPFFLRDRCIIIKTLSSIRVSRDG